MTDMAYLIDTFSLIFQVYHAIPPMTGPSGQPTNAIFGISRDLVQLLRDHHPTWLICCWDSDAPSFRNQLYPAYKANRQEMPVDLVPQIGPIRQVIEAFGIPVIEHEGWEADDVIATLARQAVARGAKVRIVSSDKDIRQLLSPAIEIYNLRKQTVLDEQGLLAEWGIRPDQVVDFQALVGDPIDNIPGVPLVGPKKAAQLLHQFGSLEDVLAHADQAPGAKLRENLKSFADQARLSRELVRLKHDLPLEFDWSAAREPQPHLTELLTLFRQFGFRRLLDDVKRLVPSESSATQQSLFGPNRDETPEASPSQGTDQIAPALTLRETESSIARRWEIVDTPEAFAQFVDSLRQQTRICLDLETTHLDPRRAELVGWAFCWEPGQAYYLPVQGPPGSRVLDAGMVQSALQPVLENPHVELLNQNIKYDLIVLRSLGFFAERTASENSSNVRYPSLGVDPMVGDYLLDAGARSHNLETLIEKYLGCASIPISELIGSGKLQKSMAEVPVEKVAEYATEDADYALRIAEQVAVQLRHEGLWDLYWNLERPLIPVLAEMEFRGIRVDAEELRRQSQAIAEQLKLLVAQIHDLAGHEFNIDSPVQLRKVLFEELHLPVFKKTKTGPSTDQDVLEELAALHPLPAKIIEHRQLSKLKGTYLDALPELIHPHTGRIHCSFNQVVAATGRLSASEPNLQNIPIRTPAGRQIRKAFVPGEAGWKLMSADYSQIELRLLAHFSQDPILCEAFAQGIDIHTAVASQVFGVAREAVTDEQRRLAKAVNFGVIYGQSPYGLATTLGISQTDAARFIDEYFARYTGVTRFLEQLLAETAQTGYARTILGRRRKIDGIRPERNLNRNMAERTAINTVIQGSAADLIKQAMVRIFARLQQQRQPAYLLLQIHDELVFEAPAAAVDSLVEIVRHEMEQALPLSVPLVVDLAVGDNWLDLEPWK